MHLQDHGVISSTPPTLFHHRLKTTLFRIQMTLQMTDPQMSDLLGMNSDSYQSFQNGKGELELTHLKSLEKSISLSLDLIFSGAIDYTSLANRIIHGEISIPERYNQPHQQLALKASLLNCVRYVAHVFGKDYSLRLFSRLQVRPDYLRSSSKWISPLLQLDYFRLLEKEGLNYNIGLEMGRFAAPALARIPRISDAVRRASISEFFECLFVQRPIAFDRLFEYRIQALDSSSCTFEIIPQAEKNDLFHGEISDCSFFCQYKIGLFSSLVTLFFLQKKNFTELSCWFKGDSCCQFKIEWDPTLK